MIACPSSRNAPPSGGASSNSSTSATRRCRMRARGRYHSRSQCVCDTTCTSNESRDVIVGQASAQKKGGHSAALIGSQLASGHRSPPCDEAIDDDDQRNHQKEVDYPTNVGDEGTEEPKDEQDDGDR